MNGAEFLNPDFIANLESWLLSHLRVEVMQDFTDDPVVGVKVRLLLDGKMVNEDWAPLPHSHGDWREER